jgi:hypothetical protein
LKKTFEEDKSSFVRLNASIEDKKSLPFENNSRSISKKNHTGPVIFKKKIES